MVTRARQGDEGALDLLLRRHYDRLHAICRRMMGSESDADDATQESLIGIVRGLDQFAGTSRFGTWAYRVAVNACLDELRRKGRRPEPVEFIEATTHPGGEGVVDDRLEISEALRQLPEDYRVAVVLRDVGGLEYGDIAQVLAIPIGTVRSRIARGRSALVPLLGGNSPTPIRRPR